jgi:hypothetical protein
MIYRHVRTNRHLCLLEYFLHFSPVIARPKPLFKGRRCAKRNNYLKIGLFDLFTRIQNRVTRQQKDPIVTVILETLGLLAIVFLAFSSVNHPFCVIQVRSCQRQD